MTSWQEIKSVLALSFSLAKTNFKLRNEGSYLGILWYLLNPLILFFIILAVRSQAFFQVDIPYYAVYLLMGLLMHNFFVQVISASISVIPLHANFIKSTQILSESIVLAKVMQAIFSHMFELFLVILALAYFSINFNGFLAYLFVFIIFSVFTAGLSFMFSALGVYFTDLNNIWAVAAQALFFITPIFYVAAPGSLIYTINLSNPLYYFISAARETSVYGTFPSLGLLASLVVVSATTLFIGWSFFRKFKGGFAERV